MSSNTRHSRNQSQPEWEQARTCTSSEVLAILAPTPDEPEAILRSYIWKTGPQAVPETGSAA